MRTRALRVCALGLLALAASACHEESALGAGRVRGAIAFPDASAVTGATATLVGPVVRAATIAPEGSWAIDALPSGAYTLFVEVPDTREARARRDVVVTAPGETVLEPIPFAPIAHLVGRFVVDGAADHRGTTVTASDGSVTTTRETGDFELAIALTTQSVVATRAGSQPSVANVTAPLRGMTIDLGTRTLLPGEAALYSVIGTIRVAGTIDAAGVKVQIESLGASALTDTDGRFALPNVPAGLYELTYARDDLADALPGVLVGLGETRVLYDGGLYELAPLELAPGRRLTRREGSYNLPVVSADGRWLAMFSSLPTKELQIWDSTTDTIAFQFPYAPPQSGSSDLMRFAGDQLIFVEEILGAQKRNLRRLDPNSGTITNLFDAFQGYVQVPESEATIVVQGWQLPEQTYTIVPWSGAPVTSLPHQKQLMPGKTSMLTLGALDPQHAQWRRLSDGALLQEGTVGAISKWAFATDRELLALQFADHVEVWTPDGIVSSATSCSGGISLGRDVLWCGTTLGFVALRTADLVPYTGGPWPYFAMSLSPDGRSALLAPGGYTPSAAAYRVLIDDSGLVTGDEVGPYTWAEQIFIAPDGFWVVGNQAVFVPRSGPITVTRPALIQQLKLASDGALLYLDSESATGSSLHRLTTAGVDTVLSMDVTSYNVLDDYAVYGRVVGDRNEQFLSRIATGEQLALGSMPWNGLAKISATDFYVTRRLAGSAPYVNGLFRVHLP